MRASGFQQLLHHAARVGDVNSGTDRAVVRTVWRRVMALASSTSGHGRPVRPAVTESYAATKCFDAQSDNASSTSSGAAEPASQALAQTDNETLGHHMIAECNSLP